MQLLKNMNLGIRFLLELCLLGSFAYAGYTIFQNQALKWVFAIGLPLAAATIWGMYIAPKAQHVLDQPQRLIVEIILFGFSSYLLYTIGSTKAAIIFMTAVILNETLLIIWKQ